MRGFRRARIAAALAEVCRERSYQRVTIADVAARAKTSRGTIYQHFANKEEIFLCLFDGASREAFEKVESACLAAGEDAERRLDDGVAALLEWVEHDPPAAWAVFVEAPCVSPESFRRYFSALADAADLLAGALPPGASCSQTMKESLVGGLAAVVAGELRAGRAEDATSLVGSLSMLLRMPWAVPSTGHG